MLDALHEALSEICHFNHLHQALHISRKGKIVFNMGVLVTVQKYTIMPVC